LVLGIWYLVFGARGPFGNVVDVESGKAAESNITGDFLAAFAVAHRADQGRAWNKNAGT
jgi:hypothetical protein